jgi:hypothetical protein
MRDGYIMSKCLTLNQLRVQALKDFWWFPVSMLVVAGVVALFI